MIAPPAAALKRITLSRLHVPLIPGAASPALDALYRRYHPDGLEVLAVNVDARRRDAEAFLRAHPCGHLLDPHSLKPSAASESVTIVSRDGTLADAMSKAAFMLGPEKGIALIDSYKGIAGLISYRRPDGHLGVALSRRLDGLFHPATH
jgi:hypothetical protein